MGSIKHRKTSTVPNALNDTRRIGGDDWNEEHEIDLEVADVNGLEARLIPVDQVVQYRDDALAYRNQASGFAGDAADSASDAATVVGSLAADDGATKVGTPDGTVQDALDGRVTQDDLSTPATVPAYAFSAAEAQSIFDNALPLQDYATAAAYTGRAQSIRITGVYGTAQANGIAGTYRYNPNAVNTSDGGTRIAHASGVGAFERSFAGAWYASWFGAGSNIDSTAALTAAIAAMPAAGGELRLPPSCDISGTITVNKPITMVGGGAAVVNSGGSGSVMRKLASLNGPALVMSSNGVLFQNFTLQGVAGNGGDGIVMLGARCVLKDMSVFQMGRDNVRLGADVGPSNVNGWLIENLRSKNAGRHNLHISDKALPILPDVNGGTLNLADLQNATGECGLYLGNNMVNTFKGILAQTNGTYGVYSSASSKGNFFYGGDYEVNGRGGTSSTSFADFFIEAGSTGNTIFGGSSFNFPVSFVCNEPQNTIVGFRDGIFSGQDKYAGLQLFNIDSTVDTVLDVYKKYIAFTPIIVGETTAGVGTYSTQIGECTRVGNQVKITGTLTWSAHTGTGPMRIAGIPFIARNAVSFQPATIIPDNITTPANSVLAGMAVPNTSAIKLWTISTAGTATRTALAMDTSGSLWFEMVMLI